MSSFKSILLIAIPAVALSCSVKEDRSRCMCCLGLDYSECNDNGDKLVLIGWDEEMTESFRSVPDANGHSEYCEYYVPRCEFTLSASVGADITDGAYVIARSGEQADSLYANTDRFLTDSEYCFRKIVLNKQFTTIRIITDNSNYSNGDIIVNSSTIGMSLPDMSPVSGNYTCKAEMLSPGIFSFRLYRQSGEVTVVLEPASGDIKAKSINLSKLLDNCGYDWKEANLRDVDLYMNKAMTIVSIQVSGWDFAETIYSEI